MNVACSFSHQSWTSAPLKLTTPSAAGWFLRSLKSAKRRIAVLALMRLAGGLCWVRDFYYSKLTTRGSSIFETQSVKYVKLCWNIVLKLHLTKLNVWQIVTFNWKLIKNIQKMFRNFILQLILKWNNFVYWSGYTECEILV